MAGERRCACGVRGAMGWSIWTRKRQPVDIEGASAEENQAAFDAAAGQSGRLDAPCPCSLDGTWHAVKSVYLPEIHRQRG